MNVIASVTSQDVTVPESEGQWHENPSKYLGHSTSGNDA